MLGSPAACLPALRWPPWHHLSLQQQFVKKTARRARRQPISGLVSLQHLGGTEPSGRLEPRQRGGGKRLEGSSTHNHDFVKSTRELEDCVARWLKHNLLSFITILTAIGNVACCRFDLHAFTPAYTNSSDSCRGVFRFVFMFVHASL